KLFEEVQAVYKMLHYRVGTGELNRFIEKVIQKYHPPMIQGRRLRIYYLTQKSVAPVAFILFINHLELMTRTYQRYLVKALRETFGFRGCAIKFQLQSKKKEKAEEAS
ncbi:MAG: ribosome biogenesis GTPase Der, partial [Chlamydiae bacterium]|nr:ribosome biogenesis GTPase Der [Chlamydiota bacterium]